MTYFISFITGFFSGVILMILGMYIATAIGTDFDDGIYEEHELEDGE